MRVIFGIKKSENHREFEACLDLYEIAYVLRFMVYRNDIKRVYVVDKDDFYATLVNTQYVDSRDTWFEVTACNKQYISENRWADDPKSLGSMCQVTVDQAMDHVFDARSHYNNWYLVDTETGMHWIAENRNPDRIGNHTSPGIELRTPSAGPGDRWPLDPRAPVFKGTVVIGC